MLQTDAHFEYVTQAQFEATGFAGATETPELDLGAGKVPQDAGAHLSGLLPDTTYRFRVVAGNEAGEDATEEPVPSFTTFAVPVVLPDNRAYEMVSPPQKAGEVIPPEPSTQLGGSCGDCLPGENTPTMPMQSTARRELGALPRPAFFGRTRGRAKRVLWRRAVQRAGGRRA